MNSFAAKPALASQDAKVLFPNRRRHVRQKIHTPAYAGIDESQSGAMLDLSEILNISEAGMCIQTSTLLEAKQSLKVCLDLSDMKSFINAAGEVVWCEPMGRAGIRFLELEEESARQLKQWLFSNTIAACMNHAGIEMPAPEVKEQPAQLDAEEPASPVQPHELAIATPARADFSTLLSAVTAVKREVEALAPKLDLALELLAERALALLHSEGAAIAIADGDTMVCRASCGQLAPGAGVQVQVGSGFSGECVRSGKMMRCDDADNDSRADAEICRALGIRSMLAVPIQFDGSVVGLIEVFSPAPNEFGENDEAILERLAQLAAAAVKQERAVTAEVEPKPALETDSPMFGSEVESSGLKSHRILLIATALTLAFVVVWLIAPWSKTTQNTAAANPISRAAAVAAKPTPQPGGPHDLASLRHLAEQGDPMAQFGMGAKYATGDGVKQDYTEAVRWFTMAAEQGHVVAQDTLGAYYWAGRGVQSDLSKAYFWSILAQAGGNELSKYRVVALTSRMSHAQVVVAQQQANEWIKTHQLGVHSSSDH